MKKILCVVAAILAVFTAAGCKNDNKPQEVPEIPWSQMSHGDKVQFALVSFGGYSLKTLTITGTGVTAKIEGCNVEFSGNDQEADPYGQTPDSSAAVQAYAEFWALSIAGKTGEAIPATLRELFWYSPNHFVTNVKYSTLREKVAAALTAGTLTCN